MLIDSVFKGFLHRNKEQEGHAEEMEVRLGQFQRENNDDIPDIFAGDCCWTGCVLLFQCLQTDAFQHDFLFGHGGKTDQQECRDDHGADRKDPGDWKQL